MPTVVDGEGLCGEIQFRFNSENAICPGYNKVTK
jgi:hypothetical protein